MATEVNKNVTSTPVGTNSIIKCRVARIEGDKILVNFKGYRVTLSTKKKYKQNDIVTVSYNNKEIKIVE